MNTVVKHEVSNCCEKVDIKLQKPSTPHPLTFNIETVSRRRRRSEIDPKSEKGSVKLFQHESNIKSFHGDVSVGFSEVV